MGSLSEPLLQSPRESESVRASNSAVSLWSRLVFSWLNPILERGSKRPLEAADLPPLGPSDQAQKAFQSLQLALQQQEEEGDKEGTTNSGSSSSHLFWLLASCQRGRLLLAGLFALLKSVTAAASPIFVRYFIALAGDGGNSVWYQGYAVAAGICLSKVLESLSERQWFFHARNVGMRMTSAVIAAVYHKQLRLSNQGRRKHPAGEILNYAAVDAFRVGEFAYWLHFIWATPLQIALCTAILFLCVGWATLAGLAVILLTMLGNHPVARRQQRAQEQLMAAQSRRLRATAEYLRSIKILKLQAWEERFREMTERLRGEESGWLFQNQHIRAAHSLLYWISPAAVSSATFAACVALGTPLNAGNVFTALAALRVVQEPLRGVPDVISALIQTRVSLARVTRFLGEDELQMEAVQKGEDPAYALQIEQACFSWDADSPTTIPTLRDINLSVEHGQLVAVCGEVGAGKSSLLMSILGEIPKTSGEVKVSGSSIAYVSQTPWIESGSIRDVILFGKAMDHDRYHSALRACALEQDIEEFPFKDLTEIGERGLNLSGGQKQRVQLARALYQDADIYLLDDPFSAVDAHTVSSLFKDYVLGALSGKVVILVTHQVEFLPAVDLIVLLQSGEIRQLGRYNEVNTEGSEFQKLILAHEEAMGLVDDSSSKPFSRGAPPVASSRSHVQVKLPGSTMTAAEPLKGVLQLTTVEEMETGTGSWEAVFAYFRQANGWFYFCASFAATAIFTLGQTVSNLWLARKVNDPSVSSSRLVTVYSTVALLACAFVYVRAWFIAAMGLAASSSFYSALSTSIFRAPMSFFDSTPTGRIITRLSSDLAYVDTDIPFTLGHSASAGLNYLVALLVTAFVTWPTLILGIPVLLISMRYQVYYLRSARQLMRINGKSKAPIVQHLGDTIAGSVTIRAFGKQQDFMQRALQLVDGNANPTLHNFAAAEWLVLRLELLAAVVLASTAVAMVVFSAYISPGMTGLALSYALSVNAVLVFAVQNQCIAANQIVSVERIRQYMCIPSEGVLLKDDSGTWPESGEVVLDNLQVRYRPNAPLVLHGISCVFKGGERVGVVGRTGSGKSTLISALFRLVEPAGGRILVDGVDIATVGLHHLRSRLAIIPQDPALFRGTVRFNLDPLAQYLDHQLWEALDSCQLGEIIRAKPGQLNSEVGDDGENWSVGQRQLFCLGRVLLRQSRILVLDEATASIDNSTDSILQKVIRKAFQGCTVITVAHRIPTVVDSDKVLALSDGKLAEFDTPSRLLAREHSFFARLVAEYWASHASEY